jgi:putative nucleotidyltransferase with HDIG domain
LAWPEAVKSELKNRILFVDDEPQVLQALRIVVKSMGEDWEMAFVESGEEALKLMAQQPFDIVVSDVLMPGLNGPQLLNEILKRYPGTIRLILSSYADEDIIVRCIGATHQALAKPFDIATLKATLRRIYRMKEKVAHADILTLVGQIGCLPSMPAIYHQLLEALQSPYCSIQRIGEIVASDPGVAAKILQLVNSAFFGFANKVSNAETAVLLLGVGVVRSLALTVHLFSAFDPGRCAGFSLENTWYHSLQVGQLARKIAELESGEDKLMEEAFTAGLLHDVGKLILAHHRPVEYSEVMAQAHKEKRPVLEVERERFHANHAELGAYLLDLWGLPTPLVEGVAFHHEPAKASEQSFSPLAAVHIANALEQERSSVEPEAALSRLDPDYIEALKLADCVQFWRGELTAK